MGTQLHGPHATRKQNDLACQQQQKQQQHHQLATSNHQPATRTAQRPWYGAKAHCSQETGSTVRLRELLNWIIKLFKMVSF